MCTPARHASQSTMSVDTFHPEQIRLQMVRWLSVRDVMCTSPPEDLGVTVTKVVVLISSAAMG